MPDHQPLPDAADRERILTDLEATFFVEAAAGTGKTTALVGRIVAALRSGAATLDRIVAVTFTEKAAGEMKLRLRSEIEKCRTDPKCPDLERRRFEQALTHLEIARIGTIHAFCGDILHERPVEARVDPLFEVSDEDEANRLLEQAFDEWFQRVLADPHEGVRRVLRRRPKGRNAMGPRSSLRAAAQRLIEHRDFDSAWTLLPFDRKAQIDHLLDQLHDIAPLAYQASRNDDWLAKNLQVIERFVDDTDLMEGVRGRDYDGLESELRDLLYYRNGWHWKGFGREYAPGISRDEIIVRRDAIKQQLEKFKEAADADLAARLREELRPVVAAYEGLKQREGKLDFLDLLVKTRDLLRDDATVRLAMQEQFTHYFVDEFQDTDPLQVEILLLLAADVPDETDAMKCRPKPGKLFLVGDPKQSIYRFRRADVVMYEMTKRRLESYGAEVLHLTTSFRAVPGIQKTVNAAFEKVMRGSDDGSQAEYVPLNEYRRERDADHPSVIALPVPRPYSRYGKVANYAIEDSLPDAVGAFVHWLINHSGWTVTERDEPEKPRPISARHICILFRRFRSFGEDIARPYVRALEARRVPHVLVGGHSFHEREEVLALRNALNAIEWPDDALRVFATLRGPLFALGDDVLLSYRQKIGTLHPLRWIQEAELGRLLPEEKQVAEALATLGKLHANRNRRPIAATMGRLLKAVRAHAGIAIWPTGEQALANVLRVVDRARRFERHGAPSFRAFVDLMDEEADRGEAEEAPIVEEGTEGVRIMTVHKAKGLEFPVVILADMTCKAWRDPPSQHVNSGRRLWAEPLCGATPRDVLDNANIESRREEAEAMRLAYVAATRARDLLVAPVVGVEQCEGWVDVLNPALYPEEDRWGLPEAAERCPEFGRESVINPPEDDFPRMVAPGAHLAQAGTKVVWWDPGALELDVEEVIGLRQDKLLHADAEEVIAQAGIRAHDDWRGGRDDLVKRGEAPTLMVMTATRFARARTGGDGQVGPRPDEGALGEADHSVERGHASPQAAGEVVEVIEVDVDRAERAGGVRFGTLVHAVLAVMDLEADDEALRRAVVSQGRLVGASPEELEAAVVTVRRALEHPVLQRARAAHRLGGLRREAPILLRKDGRELIEGVVDLAFREGERDAAQWVVVDFKTDRELSGERAVYEQQVRLYADAVATATGEPARPVLLVL